MWRYSCAKAAAPVMLHDKVAGVCRAGFKNSRSGLAALERYSRAADPGGGGREIPHPPPVASKGFF